MAPLAANGSWTAFGRAQVSAAAAAGSVRSSSPALVRASWSFDMSGCWRTSEEQAGCRLCLPAYMGLLDQFELRAAGYVKKAAEPVVGRVGHGFVHCRLALLALRPAGMLGFLPRRASGFRSRELRSRVGLCCSTSSLAELFLRVSSRFYGRVCLRGS